MAGRQAARCGLSLFRRPGRRRDGGVLLGTELTVRRGRARLRQPRSDGDPERYGGLDSRSPRELSLARILQSARDAVYGRE